MNQAMKTKTDEENQASDSESGVKKNKTHKEFHATLHTNHAFYCQTS
jgi:hypothetical protein